MFLTGSSENPSFIYIVYVRNILKKQTNKQRKPAPNLFCLELGGKKMLVLLNLSTFCQAHCRMSEAKMQTHKHTHSLFSYIIKKKKKKGMASCFLEMFWEKMDNLVIKETDGDWFRDVCTTWGPIMRNLSWNQVNCRLLVGQTIQSLREGATRPTTERYPRPRFCPWQTRWRKIQTEFQIPTHFQSYTVAIGLAVHLLQYTRILPVCL